MDRFDDDTLFAELRGLRPTPRPEFAAELDERAAAGFPRRETPSAAPMPFALLADRWRALSPSRRLIPVLARRAHRPRGGDRGRRDLPVGRRQRTRPKTPRWGWPAAPPAPAAPESSARRSGRSGPSAFRQAALRIGNVHPPADESAEKVYEVEAPR